MKSKTNPICDAIQELERQSLELSEADIICTLEKINISVLSREERALGELEHMTFCMTEQYNWNNWDSDNKKPWGTYFGPILVSKDMKTYPELGSINKEMVKYWFDRIDQVQHPVLRVRYAGLVYDFCKFTDSNKLLIPAAKAFIENCILLSQKRLHKFERNGAVDKLWRAFEVARSIRNNELVIDVKNEMLVQLGRNANLEVMCKMLQNSKKMNFLEDEVEKVIVRVQSFVSGRCPAASLEAVKILANYHKSIGDEVNVKKIINAHVNFICDRYADPEVPIPSKHYLEEALKCAKDYGLSRKVVEKISLKTSEINAYLHNDMHDIKIDVKINARERDELIDEILLFDPEALLEFLIERRVPTKQFIEQCFGEEQNRCVFTYSSSRTAVGEGGKTLANLCIGDNALYSYAHKHLVFNWPIINGPLISKAIDSGKLSLEQCLDKLSKSRLYPKNRREILMSGLKSYFDGDYVGAVHVLIPCFERGIRELLRFSGIEKLTPKKSGGLNEYNLSQMLYMDELCNIISEDHVFYFKVIFAHDAGINLRNTLLHGIGDDSYCFRVYADLVFQSILILSNFAIDY